MTAEKVKQVETELLTASLQRVKDQMLAILIGGKVGLAVERSALQGFADHTYRYQDPGAIVLVWIMYDLARHPKIMQRLRQEIHQTSVIPVLFLLEVALSDAECAQCWFR